MALTDLSFSELESMVSSLKVPKFRAEQIRKWVFNRLVTSYDEMTDLPLELRVRLSALLPVGGLTAAVKETSRDNLTRKVLFRLGDGNVIESVLMSYGATSTSRRRRSVCISTQVGCGYGCAFCATGAGGLTRNLTSGEIVEQVFYFDKALRLEDSDKDEGQNGADRRISNIVFMGMGEPLANYEATIKAIETLNDAAGYNLGSRHMTVSTVGIIPGIKRLSKENFQVGLAISLHAANQKLRERLVPVAKRYPLAALMKACEEYISSTGRRLTFEYALADGVNDSPDDARELAGLLAGMLCHVNLIPVNPSDTNQFRPPSAARIKAFQVLLARKGIAATLRVERGADIKAACGQLRAKVMIPSV